MVGGSAGLRRTLLYKQTEHNLSGFCTPQMELLGVECLPRNPAASTLNIFKHAASSCCLDVFSGRNVLRLGISVQHRKFKCKSRLVCGQGVSFLPRAGVPGKDILSLSCGFCARLSFGKLSPLYSRRQMK